jgi:hypothetical protein
MVDFRRLTTAFALLAVFAAIASAQGPVTCSTNVAVTPTLRAEGFTEQTGDITLLCSGGLPPAPGVAIPQINILLFFNTMVTSRLLPVSNVSNNISEALLLIDDPGSGEAGSNSNQTLCATPLTGCQEFVGSGNAYGTCTGTITGSGPTATCSAVSTTAPQNVFQGVLQGTQQVQFFGIPFLAPGSVATRTIRITNVRVNASQLSGGSAAGSTPVITSISISGATSVPVSNPTPTVGFVQAGLSASASSSTSLNQCTSQTRVSVNTLTFSENFPTAFKTRIAAQSNGQYAAQGIPGVGGLPSQNVPGSIYNSESNFVFPIAGGGQIAGLADFGTRLRAVFNNVPAGVRLFVSTANVVNNAIPVTAPTPPGGTSTSTYAQLVTSETTSDGSAAGFFPAVTATDNGPSGGNVPVAEITIVNGSGQAVWELVNTNPNANETVKFAVYATYVANVGQNSPPPGTGTVNLSYGPAPTSAFSAQAGAMASSTLSIPRFIADTSAARNILVVNICRTILLYPFVTNIQGFDTGLAIANTTSDPFGTAPQAGNCLLNWYQGASNPPPLNTGTIASGTVYTSLASTVVPGFNGYMIAVCNFQFAHGFTFISDVGARNLAMGYLAVVIADPASQSNNVRNAVPLGGSFSTQGEQGAH